MEFSLLLAWKKAAAQSSYCWYWIKLSSSDITAMHDLLCPLCPRTKWPKCQRYFQMKRKVNYFSTWIIVFYSTANLITSYRWWLVLIWGVYKKRPSNLLITHSLRLQDIRRTKLWKMFLMLLHGAYLCMIFQPFYKSPQRQTHQTCYEITLCA